MVRTGRRNPPATTSRGLSRNTAGPREHPEWTPQQRANHEAHHARLARIREEHAPERGAPGCAGSPGRSRSHARAMRWLTWGSIAPVSYTDLSDQHFDGHPYATRRSVNHMIRAGLIEEHEATGPAGQTFTVLTATERGRDAAQRAAVDAGHVPEQQTWSGHREARRAVA